MSPARLSKYSAAVSDASCTAVRLCAIYCAVLARRKPIEFHTSNIQRAQTKRRAQRVERLENPIKRPPEGRSLRDVLSVNGTQNQNAFSARKRYFAFPASLFCVLFSDKPEKSMPPEAFRTDWCRNACASGAFEKQQRLHFGYKKPPLRAAFHLPTQQSFAPAGMASSTISRCSFSSPFSLWTAEISIPQDWRPIILRGGRLIIATSVLPTSSSGL